MEYQQQQNQIYLPKQQITIIIQHKKGSGSQGSVFQGFIKNTNQKVAIKIVKELNPKEEIILQTIQNRKPKYIIGVNAIEKLNNEIYIVMELAEMDFYQFMNTNKFNNFDIEEKSELFFQMILGVQEFHNLSYFHRDLKPENFVCCTDQQQKLIIKLIDFGISKSQQDAGRQTLNIGTPYYMAHEIFYDEKYTKAVDIWSLGTIWYEMITRKTFFEGMSQYAIINKINQIEQNQINQKIDQLNQVQNNFREIIKQMICIDSQKRIKLEDVIIQIQKMSEQQRLQKIEKELKIKFQQENEQKEIQMIQKLDEHQQKLKQDQEYKIEQIKQQLQDQYNQQVITKEKELRSVIEQLASNKNKELLIQQELQYQQKIDEYKKQCQIQLEKQLKQEIQIQNQLNEELIRQQQRENDELKKQISQELEAKYYIEIQKREQELQVKAQNQLKKELNLKKQSFNDIIYLLKDVIKNSIITIEKQKQEINSYQLLSSDKEHLQQKILNFINQKQFELNQIIQVENNLENLEESQQYSLILKLETQYKNYFQIHNYETNEISQAIQNYIIKFQKEIQIQEIQEKQKYEQEQNQQEMNKLQKKYQQLKVEFDQQSQSIENIKILCENYSEYNNKVNEKFKELKQKYCDIDTLFNQIRQFYEIELNCISKDFINYIQKQQQEIQQKLKLFEETINKLNDLILDLKQELKNEIQNYLFQMEDLTIEIDYVTQNNLKDLDENYQSIKNQFKEKQNNIYNLQQQLKQLNVTEISIPKYIQIRTLYHQEADSLKSLKSQVLKHSQKQTQLKIIQQQKKDYFEDIKSKSLKFQELIYDVQDQLKSIKNKCNLFKNQDINKSLDKIENDLNEFQFMTIQKFEELFKKILNINSKQSFNLIKQETDSFLQELSDKQDQWLQLIRNLSNLQNDEEEFQKIQNELKLLIQNFNHKQNNFVNLDLQNYECDQILILSQKQQILDEQKQQMQNLHNSFNKNQEVMQKELDFSQEGNKFKKQKQNYSLQIENIHENTYKHFVEFTRIIDIIQKFQDKIQFTNLDEQQKTQKKWLEQHSSIVQLNGQLQNLLVQYKQVQEQKNNIFRTQQNKQLIDEYNYLKNQVTNLLNDIPQNQQIKQFEENYQKNFQSLIILYSIIIIIKAYNAKRYGERITIYEKSIEIKQQQQIQELKKSIQYNQGSKEKYEIEVLKLNNKKDRKNFENTIETGQLLDKYISNLNELQNQYKLTDLAQDEKYLDDQIQQRFNIIKQKNLVKLRAMVKDQKQVQEIANQCFESLEFSRLFGLNLIGKYIMKKKD